MSRHYLLRKILSVQFLDKLDRDKIFDLAASLSYYTTLSLAPILVLLLTLISVLDDSLQAKLLLQLEGLVGATAGQTIKAIAENAEKTPQIRDIASFFGVLTLLISSGAIFSQLRASLNIIFEVKNAEVDELDRVHFWKSTWNYIKRKIFSLGFVLTFVFISALSLIASSFITLLLEGLAATLGELINFLVTFLIFSILFMAVYFFLPQKRIKPRVVHTAGFMTALLFSIGKSLIGIFVGRSALASLYGAAGSLVVLLMWVYYSSVIIFLSAEIANEMDKSGKGS